MANFFVFKETALPGTLVANAMYIIAPPPPADQAFVEFYVTDAAGVVAKRTPSKTDVEAWVAAAVSTANTMEVVADITARDALTMTANGTVLVIDASADPSVATGAATYVYNYANSTFTKISETESMDVILQWANIIGGPTSTPAAIDAAVTATHSHLNKTQLDKIGEDADGDLSYDGAFVRTSWDATSW